MSAGIMEQAAPSPDERICRRRSRWALFLSVQALGLALGRYDLPQVGHAHRLLPDSGSPLSGNIVTPVTGLGDVRRHDIAALLFM